MKISKYTTKRKKLHTICSLVEPKHNGVQKTLFRAAKQQAQWTKKKQSRKCAHGRCLNIFVGMFIALCNSVFVHLWLCLALLCLALPCFASRLADEFSAVFFVLVECIRLESFGFIKFNCICMCVYVDFRLKIHCYKTLMLTTELCVRWKQHRQQTMCDKLHDSVSNFDGVFCFPLCAYLGHEKPERLSQPTICCKIMHGIL